MPDKIIIEVMEIEGPRWTVRLTEVPQFEVLGRMRALELSVTLPGCFSSWAAAMSVAGSLAMSYRVASPYETEVVEAPTSRAAVSPAVKDGE